MLTPEYLDGAPDEMVKLWQQVEDDILRDIGRRIGKMDGITDTAEWQAFRLAETRGLRTDVVKTLAKYSGKSEAAIRKILQQAGAEALAADDAVYREAGLTPGSINESTALVNLLNAGCRQTSGTWKNLTATTANTVTKQFENSLSRAWLQVYSGAFDYKTAIKRSVDDLSQTMQGVTYPSGHHDSLEVACRRAVLTGVNQTAGKLQVARMDEMGCDFVEVSAHAGARPEHAVWQGKVYHRGGDIVYHGERYADFENATHYGSGDGLCGWNCRHNFYPFFPGLSERAYGDKELQQLKAKTETYNGKQYTKYEISQMQRAIERKVRSAKKQYLAEDAAGIDSTNAAVKYRNAQQQLKQFVRDTGGRVDSSRSSVSGFGYSAASRVTWSTKKYFQNPQEFATIKSVSGGRITNQYGGPARLHAKRYYGLVRSMKTDVARIAANTGFSEEDIAQIKSFIFMEKHDLGGEDKEYFEPDFSMAQSWQRLINGTPEQHDLTLLNHEEYERELMQSGLTQDEAHTIASKKYNYQKESDEYYAALKKHKNNK